MLNKLIIKQANIFTKFQILFLLNIEQFYSEISFFWIVTMLLSITFIVFITEYNYFINFKTFYVELEEFQIFSLMLLFFQFYRYFFTNNHYLLFIKLLNSFIAVWFWKIAVCPPGISTNWRFWQFVQFNTSCLNVGHEYIWIAISFNPWTNSMSDLKPFVKFSNDLWW